MPAVKLFDEWGTSGRIRPTLGHLLQLLTELKFFLVADYIAVELLNEPPPQRPNASANDPAARINISIGFEDDDDGGLRSSALSEMDYPSTRNLLGAASGAIGLNKDFYEKLGQDHVKKVVIDVDSIDTTLDNTSEMYRPAFSGLLTDDDGSRLTVDEDVLPDISELNIRSIEMVEASASQQIETTSSDRSADIESDLSNFNPNLSDLMSAREISTSANIPNIFSTSANIPNVFSTMTNNVQNI